MVAQPLGGGGGPPLGADSAAGGGGLAAAGRGPPLGADSAAGGGGGLAVGGCGGPTTGGGGGALRATATAPATATGLQAPLPRQLMQPPEQAVAQMMHWQLIQPPSGNRSGGQWQESWGGNSSDWCSSQVAASAASRSERHNGCISC